MPSSTTSQNTKLPKQMNQTHAVLDQMLDRSFEHMPRIHQSNQKPTKRKLREHNTGPQEEEDDIEEVPATVLPKSRHDGSFNRSQPTRFMPERDSEILFASEVK